MSNWRSVAHKRRSATSMWRHASGEGRKAMGTRRPQIRASEAAIRLGFGSKCGSTPGLHVRLSAAHFPASIVFRGARLSPSPVLPFRLRPAARNVRYKLRFFALRGSPLDNSGLGSWALLYCLQIVVPL